MLLFLDLAGFVVAFLGWWGALFMGRLPEFAVTYLSRAGPVECPGLRISCTC